MFQFSYTGLFLLQMGEIGRKECVYFSSVLEAEQAYSQLYKKYTGVQMLTRTSYISSQVGSNVLKKVSIKPLY